MLSSLPRWLGLLVLVTASCTLAVSCYFPRDPGGTLKRVSGGELRVGIATDEPWTRRGEEPSGVEVELIRQFAGELDAEIVWVPGSAPDLLGALEQHELDLVIAGLTTDSEDAKQKAGLTNTYISTRQLVGIPPSSKGFEDLSGREVAVELGDPAAAILKEKGARPVYVRDLSARDAPLAAYDWQLEAWGLKSTGIELVEEKHIMAVPRGENAWLVRLEQFLATRRQEVERMLREEAAR